MARMKHLRHMPRMKRGNHDFSMPEEQRVPIEEPDESDDEDGFSWDPDLGGDLGDENEEEDGLE